MERVPIIVLIGLFLAFCNYGELIASPVTDGLDVDSIRYLLKSMGGALGVKALGISGTLIQILIRVLQSKVSDRFFQKQKPWVRLGLISALTFLITPIGLMTIGGVPFAAAILHSATLNAFMVFLDQVLKHAPEKKKVSCCNATEK